MGCHGAKSTSLSEKKLDLVKQVQQQQQNNQENDRNLDNLNQINNNATSVAEQLHNQIQPQLQQTQQLQQQLQREQQLQPKTVYPMPVNLAYKSSNITKIASAKLIITNNNHQS